MAALNHVPDRFVLLPFRKGEKDVPDWSLCSKFIATNHSSNNTSSVAEAIKSMMLYHNTIVKVCVTDSKTAPSEAFIKHTLMEYCSLVGKAQAHLPLNEGTISKKLRYVWTDSFDSWNKYESLNSSSELLSCIYNLAASLVSVAAGQAQSGTVEGVKDAYKNFQVAAGYYTMVEQLSGRLPPDQLTKGDMKKESLQMLVKVCLASAHHCGYLKAEEAMKGKHEMLAKIAMQGAKLYEEAHVMMRASAWYQTKTTEAKDAELTLQAARHIFEARANLHLAVKSEEEAEMGVAIAYYLRAMDALGRLPKMSTQAQTTWVNSIVSAVNAAHGAADKANASVYFARIPKEVPPPEPLPRPLGQALEQPSFTSFESKRGSDPFFGILPAHIASTARDWRGKQRSRVETCTSAATNTRKTSTQKMQQLGVMAAIQTLSGEVQDRGRVPEPLRSNILALRGGNPEKSQAVTQQLVERVKTCRELARAADDKLQGIKQELAEEKAEDAQYESSYGEKMWRAVCASAETLPDYNAIMAAYSEHKRALQERLANPLTSASKTLDDNLRDIARLDWKMSDLDDLMPFVQSKEARQQSSKVMTYVEKLKTIMSEKERLENEQLAEQRALMDVLESDAVVFGLSSVEGTQRDAVLTAETTRISDAIERINANSREQTKLVADAEAAMEELSKLQSTDPIAQEIQRVSNGLENACNVYTELIREFGDIANNAQSIMESIESTVDNAKSFRTVRKLSAEELQNRLDAQIALKMSQMKDTESQIEQSRLRQQQLQSELTSLIGAGGAARHSMPAPLPQQQQQQHPAYVPPPNFQPTPVVPQAMQQPFAPPDDRPPSYDTVLAHDRQQALAYQPPAGPGNASPMYTYQPVQQGPPPNPQPGAYPYQYPPQQQNPYGNPGRPL